MDTNSQLRPVLGVAGASTLGFPIAVDDGLRVLQISPHQDYFLAARAGTMDAVVLRNPRTLDAATIAGSTGTSNAILSPQGSSAVLIFADGKTWRVVTGLPETPEIVWQIDAANLPEGCSPAAVSDGGEAILATVAFDGGESVYLITPRGLGMLSSTGQSGGVAFIAHRTDALIADRSSNQVKLITDLTGQAAQRIIADSAAGVSAPVAVASSEDGRKAFIANAQPGGVLALDLESGESRTLTCDCTPASLVRLSQDSMFRLTDSAAGAFWVMDGGANPRIVIVPPDAPGESGATATRAVR